MGQGQHDRRQYVRQSVNLPCRVDGAITGGVMRVTNLSAGGCFISTRGFLTAGTEVTIHTKCAGVELGLPGRVVHVVPGRGFAIEFGNLPGDIRQLLEQFLTQAPASSN